MHRPKIARGLYKVLIVVASLASLSASAQSAAMLVSPELSRYLGLSGEQIQMLAQRQREHQSELAAATKQAASLRDAADLAALCERMKSRQAQAQTQAKGVLAPDQLSRLDSLQEAYARMPLVEAAQRLALLSSDIKAPPLALSQGTMELAIRYVRSEAVVLPGCAPAAGRPFATQQISAH